MRMRDAVSSAPGLVEQKLDMKYVLDDQMGDQELNSWPQAG